MKKERERKQAIVWKRTKKTRAEKAGVQMGKSICESVNLMYQNNTAINFLVGLQEEINKELARRL